MGGNKRANSVKVISADFECRLTEIRSEQAAIISNLKKEVSELQLGMSEIHDSLDFAHREIWDLQSMLSKRQVTDGPVDPAMKERLVKVEKNVGSLELHVDYLDNYSRRNNIRIDGVTEATGETWDSTESKCQKLFNDLGLTGLQVQRAHHTGPKRQGKPRMIVIQMTSFKDREAILARAKQQHPGNIYFNKDFSARVSRILKKTCALISSAYTKMA